MRTPTGIAPQHEQPAPRGGRLALVSLALVALLSAGLSASAGHNVLVIVADDLGTDRIGVYAEHPDPGNTPNIDLLAGRGVLFRNAWANPVCTTSRAAIMTGRHSFRTGVGGGAPVSLLLQLEETTLAEVVEATHETYAVGKWHLSVTSELTNALQQGFDEHWGSMGSLKETQGETYFDYAKNLSGTLVQSTTYATTDTVDDALTLMAGATDPWFMYLCFNAPHSPFHKPPEALHSFDLPASIGQNISIHTKAAIEAMDTEIGRLFSTMGSALLDETLIVFVGDNGSSKAATTLPFPPEHGKGTIYEGGVNVPLIVAGPGVVQGQECDALVNATDLFATVADYVQVPQTTGTDSVSLVPYFSDPAQPSLRDWVYAEWFTPDGIVLKDEWNRVARDDQYKVVLRYYQDMDPFDPRQVEFYDLLADPFEQSDLLDPGRGPLTPGEQTAYDTLFAAASGIVGPWTNFGEALAGTHGEPLLEGQGTLAGDEVITVSLSGALENALDYLLIGFDELGLPYKGGTIVPDINPPGLLLAVPTDASGELVIPIPLPSVVPSGLHIYFQHWIQDPGGPFGWSASNGLAGTSE